MTFFFVRSSEERKSGKAFPGSKNIFVNFYMLYKFHILYNLVKCM